MATRNLSYGAYTALTVTNLQSLVSSQTVGWRSALIDNQTSVKAIDYEIVVKLTTAATTPANDKVVYLYLAPAVTTDGGTTWLIADQGTATLPVTTEGSTTIATPNDLRFLAVMNYTTVSMTMQGIYLLSDIMNTVPDGFCLIAVNFSGAALSTGCVVSYRAITETIV